MLIKLLQRKRPLPTVILACNRYLSLVRPVEGDWGLLEALLLGVHLAAAVGAEGLLKEVVLEAITAVELTTFIPLALPWIDGVELAQVTHVALLL